VKCIYIYIYIFFFFCRESKGKRSFERYTSIREDNVKMDKKRNNVRGSGLDSSLTA
jgi:hypothetical protein